MNSHRKATLDLRAEIPTGRQTEKDGSLLFLFQPIPFRFGFHVRRKSREWFSPQPGDAGLLVERKNWIRERREKAIVELPEAAPAVAELWRQHHGTEPVPTDPLGTLGGEWAVDFLVLTRSPGEPEPRFTAGCVAFPSAWDPAEKAGRPVSEIHAPVPGLNADLGKKIGIFLERISTEDPMERENWGLAATPWLNQHPELGRPRLTEDSELDASWLRVEHQAFFRLPESGALLFLIRLKVHSLRDLRRDPAAAAALAGQLQTMPEEIAVYKGLAKIRHRWAEELLQGPR